MSEKHSEELRLALVMNGGVSLAVWMGGVSNEIFRLVKEKHPVYQQLLDLTHTRARVDVMSGSSAGGINAAALTLAILYEGDFSQLRQVWLSTGDFAELLRAPLADNPGSLLAGDEFFLPALEEAFARLAERRSAPASAADSPIDLRLTTTLFDGRVVNTIDDLGSEVRDVDHRATFHFAHLDDGSPFKDRAALVTALARAARSTASFPFAFEPSQVAAAQAGALEDATGMPLPAAAYTLLDGGVLDNKPFRNALRAIFRMQATHSVRRVLLYVNPDAGGRDARPTDPVRARPGDERLPSLASVLSASVVGIPQAQAITDQLASLGEHNDAIRARRDGYLTLVKSLSSAQCEDLAKSLFPIYRKRRISDSFDLLFADLVRSGARQSAGAPDVPQGKRRRDWLRTGFLALHERAPGDVFVDGWIPAQWPPGPDATAYQGANWEWGLFPVEFAARLAMDLLRRIQRLVHDAPNPRAPDPPTPAPVSESGPNADFDWNDPDGERAGAVLDEGSPLAQQLARCWEFAYQIIDKIAAQRRAEDLEWARRSTALTTRQKSSGEPLNAQHLVDLLEMVRQASRRQQCGTLAIDLANLIVYSLPLAREVSDHALERNMHREEKAEAKALLDLHRFFSKAPGAAPEAYMRDLIYRIVQLEVIEYSFTDHDELANDGIVELVQVSGNTASPLGGARLARDKLCGLQMAHFAAFYKRSWRANDWAFGRLDGAERLVKILLNPERLYRYFKGRSDQALAQIRAIAFESVASPLLRHELATRWNDQLPAIREELRFLDRADPQMPELLAHCADAVTARLHYGILREELPAVKEAVIEDQSRGADAAGPGFRLLQALQSRSPVFARSSMPFTPSEAVAQLRAGLIGRERFLDEAGSDLFTRTSTHALAALQGALASKGAHLGLLGALFAALRLPVIALYLLSGAIVRSSRTGAAILGAILTVGTALVAAQFLFGSDALAAHSGTLASFVSFGWMLLAIGLFFPLARAPVSTLIALLLFGTVGAFYTHSAALVSAILLVMLIVWSVGKSWLQFLVGVGALAFAALWGSGDLGPVLEGLDEKLGAVLTGWGIAPGSGAVLPHQKVLLTAALVALALMLALWQASSLSRAFESGLRRWWRALSVGVARLWRWTRALPAGVKRATRKTPL